MYLTKSNCLRVIENPLIHHPIHPIHPMLNNHHKPKPNNRDADADYADYAEEQEHRRRMLDEYRRKKEIIKEKKELIEKTYIQPFVVPVRVDHPTHTNSNLGESIEELAYSNLGQNSQHAVESSYGPPLRTVSKRHSTDQGPLTVADLNSSRNTATRTSSTRPVRSVPKLSGKPMRVPSAPVLVERANFALPPDLDPVASRFVARQGIGLTRPEDNILSVPEIPKQEPQAQADPFVSSSLSGHTPRSSRTDDPTLTDTCFNPLPKAHRILTTDPPDPADLPLGLPSTPTRYPNLSKPQRILVPAAVDEPPTTPVRPFPKHMTTPSVFRSPSLGPPLRVATPIVAQPPTPISETPQVTETQNLNYVTPLAPVSAQDMMSRLTQSKRKSLGTTRTPSEHETGARIMMSMMGERIESARALAGEERGVMDVERRLRTPPHLSPRNTRATQTNLTSPWDPSTTTFFAQSSDLFLDAIPPLDKATTTADLPPPSPPAHAVSDFAMQFWTPTPVLFTPSTRTPAHTVSDAAVRVQTPATVPFTPSMRALSTPATRTPARGSAASRRGSVARPRFQLPRSIVLRVVDPATGTVLSEEAVPVPHLALFRLRDVIAAASVCDEPLVRALFTIVSARCPRYHRRCVARARGHAQYWLARTSFEEACGRQEEVTWLFEEAFRIGAERDGKWVVEGGNVDDDVDLGRWG
ncbi:hypothetical protein BC938DRAFT_475672, partial [Jimgerdemannia flammicorona]